LPPEVLRAAAHVAPGDPTYSQRDFLGELPYWGNWPEHFDFVLWLDFAGRPADDTAGLDLVTGGDFFRIYRVIGP
jgi:hypothetical protein